MTMLKCCCLGCQSWRRWAPIRAALLGLLYPLLCLWYGTLGPRIAVSIDRVGIIVELR